MSKSSLDTKERTDLFDKISDELFDGIVMIGSDDKIVFWNKTAEKMFGYDRNEVMQKTLHDIIPAQVDMAKYKKSITEFGKTGHSAVLGKLLELEVKRKNGEHFLMELSVSAMEIDGQWHAVGIMRDISQRKKIEVALTESDTLKNFLIEIYQKAPNLNDKELYDYVLEKAVLISKSKIGFFHRVSDDQKDVILTTWNGAAMKECSAPNTGHYPLAKAGNWVDCVKEQKPVVYNNYASSPNQKGLPKGHVSLSRFMSVPIIQDKKVKIIFGVGNKESDYIQEDIDKVQILANGLYNILVQRSAEEGLKKQKEDLEKKARELEEINDLMVDRELKMIELKKELSQLKGESKEQK